MTLTAPAQGQWAGSHHSIDNLTGGWMAHQTASSSVAWGTQYRAIYIPLRVPNRCVVRKLGFASTTTSAGNCDIGLYDSSGAQVVAATETTKSANVFQVFNTTDTTVGPGLYYLGLNSSTTTDTFVCYSLAAPIPAALGVLAETLGSVTLPATATWAVANTLTFIPVVSALLVTEIS